MLHSLQEAGEVSWAGSGPFRFHLLQRPPPHVPDALLAQPGDGVTVDLGNAGSGSGDWTLESLIGFVDSTSTLNLTVVGDHRDEFEEDLCGRLTSHDPDGSFTQTASYAHELARRPS